LNNDAGVEPAMSRTTRSERYHLPLPTCRYVTGAVPPHTASSPFNAPMCCTT
jgi:hypothetical protein